MARGRCAAVDVCSDLQQESDRRLTFSGRDGDGEGRIAGCIDALCGVGISAALCGVVA